jgi:hypothetical protein
VHRVDPLALALSLAGLALATAGRGTLAAVPLALAVLTKQTYLAAPRCVGLLLVLPSGVRAWYRTLNRPDWSSRC